MEQITNRVDQIIHYVIQGISEETWKKGEKIPSEQALCTQFSTSRSTVRTALGRLVGLGAIETQKGRGSFVKEGVALAPLCHQPLYFPKQVDHSKVQELRKIIEAESAVLAAARATQEEIRQLEATILSMEQGQDSKTITQQDMLFHLIIAQATGNEMLVEIFKSLQENYFPMFQENIAMLGSFGASYHRKILLAIQTRDIVAARETMLAHLDASYSQVRKYKQQQQSVAGGKHKGDL